MKYTIQFSKRNCILIYNITISIIYYIYLSLPWIYDNYIILVLTYLSYQFFIMYYYLKSINYNFVVGIFYQFNNYNNNKKYIGIS